MLKCLHEKDRNYYFSFHNLQDKMALSEIRIDKHDAERTLQKMLKMEEIIVDLSNLEYTETFYSLLYRDFVVFVARLLSLSDEEFSKAGARLSIIRDDSPIFHLELSQK